MPIYIFGVLTSLCFSLTLKFDVGSCLQPIQGVCKADPKLPVFKSFSGLTWSQATDSSTVGFYISPLNSQTGCVHLCNESSNDLCKSRYSLSDRSHKRINLSVSSNE